MINSINTTKQNNTQFKGFKNVIHNVCTNKNCRGCFSYMAMQLDNVGTKDLEAWHAIQKIVLHRDKLKDTITFSLVKDFDGNKFVLANSLLEFTSEMLNTDFEKYMLKAYGLMASLTKRIGLRMPIYNDSGIVQTVEDAKEDLVKVFDNEELVKDFMLDGIKPDSSARAVIAARVLNEAIQEKMEDYLDT